MIVFLCINFIHKSLCFRYLLLYWRVEDQEVIVVDGDRVQPVIENWIVHLKKLLPRNVMLTLLMSYINASGVL